MDDSDLFGSRVLSGKIAIVTGGSRGIGAAIVKQFVSLGARVAFTYLNNADQANAIVQQSGGAAIALKCDVRDSAKASSLVQTTTEHFGAAEILINNAGAIANKLTLKMTDEAWHSVLDTCLSGTFYTIRAVLPSMVRNRRGRIINISSIAGSHGMAGQSNYCAAKAGIAGLTRAVAKEVAKANITVNCVAPGFVDTDMTNNLEREKSEAFRNSIPMARFGSQEEIARLVTFLVCGESNYITGQTIAIDGGLTI